MSISMKSKASERPKKSNPGSEGSISEKKIPRRARSVLPSAASPRAVRDFGRLYLVMIIVERLGLGPLLRTVWPGTAQELLFLAIYQLVETKLLYLARAWAEGADVDPRLDLSSQRLSRLMEELGREEDRRLQFFEAWMKQQRDIRAILFDITSLSSYSKLIEEIEWGYNRDGDRLP